MSLIELVDVRYRYEDATSRALEDITLRIDAGAYILLAGASGSGKSTFCRLLDGLIPHFYGGTLDGRVRVDGLETRRHPVHELFARVGLVFQNPAAQLFNSTVEREIAFGLESLSLPREEIRSRVGWALQATGIEPLRERAPHALSGGEQQIVALAAILALRPRVLVLDEPFANLDPQSIQRIRGILRDIHSHGTTLVLAEHRLHATVRDATRLVVLEHGRIAHDQAPRQVLREDMSSLRLNTPFVVGYARASGWNEVPLSVEEALTMAKALGNVTLPERRDGAGGNMAAAGAPAVVLRGVSFTREGREVLRNVHLELRRGECVALVGRNGSGKTTLLKHLNGLLRPTRGSVTLLGAETRTARVPKLARHVGLVFQNPNDQLFKPNVREEIEVAPRALGRLDRNWIDRLSEEFALKPLLERSPFTLSEGEKKRVAFAAALASRPEVVALDEPTTGQDGAFREALARLLKELQAQGLAVLLATHDLEFAERVAPRWAVLADGEIAADGSPDHVMGDAETMARAGLEPTARFRLLQGLAAQARATSQALAPTR